MSRRWPWWHHPPEGRKCGAGFHPAPTSVRKQHPSPHLDLLLAVLGHELRSRFHFHVDLDAHDAYFQVLSLFRPKYSSSFLVEIDLSLARLGLDFGIAELA